jgi:hypothetical protein
MPGSGRARHSGCARVRAILIDYSIVDERRDDRFDGGRLTADIHKHLTSNELRLHWHIGDNECASAGVAIKPDFEQREPRKQAALVRQQILQCMQVASNPVAGDGEQKVTAAQ